MIQKWTITDRNEFERAAIAVLRKVKGPLKVREILERAYRQGLIESGGKTPQNTLYNAIRRANERSRALGKPELFGVAREGKVVRYFVK